ncbi:uncharacterized protein LOC142230166 [Haematobia irritans]|uniref:uncharacterized protein LOC142230166 n=1 Tax=Haematobia irritans TaxID=7368 RepID=UPI003F50BFFF
MKLVLLIISAISITKCHGGMILHNIRDSLHSKVYGHGLHGDNPNSPIININNYQEVSQQTSSTNNHNRGDHGYLSGYGEQLYGPGSGNGLVNTNVKAGGIKYGYAGSMEGYGSHNSMKQESYHHRQGPKFGQHHDPNIFGNTKIGSTSSSASSSSSSMGSSSVSSSSSSSSSSVVGNDGYYSSKVKPWRY